MTMAETGRDRRPTDFGLIESIDPWSDLPVYQGTPEQFIASGLLTPEQIPSEPGCPKIVAFRFESDGRRYTVTRGRKSHVIKLRVSRPNKEEAKRIEDKTAREHEAWRVADQKCTSTMAAARAEEMREALFAPLREFIQQGMRVEKEQGKGRGIAFMYARMTILDLQWRAKRTLLERSA